MNSVNRVKGETQEPFIKALKAGEIKITRPKWNTIEIADKAYQVRLMKGAYGGFRPKADVGCGLVM